MRLMTIACAVLSAMAPLAHAAGPAAELVGAGTVSTGADESHPTFSPDGKTLYFLRNAPNFRHWTVMISQASGDGWSAPQVAPFSGRWSDADVFVTPDGNALYFISKRPLADGGQPRADTEIWMMTRQGDDWGAPVKIDALSSDQNEWFPSIAASGTIYFGSERPGGLGGTDIWRARREGDHFAPPENLGAPINTTGDEIEAHIAPDESYLIFAADGQKPNGGAYDLYVSYACNGTWSAPQALGGDANSDGWDFGARVSPDGQYLYFSSNRTAIAAPFDPPVDAAALDAKLASPGNGLRDIYRVKLADVLPPSNCAR